MRIFPTGGCRPRDVSAGAVRRPGLRGPAVGQLRDNPYIRRRTSLREESSTSPPSQHKPRAWGRTVFVVGLLLASLGSFAVLQSPNARAGTPPTGFADTLVTSGLTGPISLAFLPDGSGRAVIIQQGGVIRAWDGATLSTLHTMAEVNTNGNERGLLGVAVDPDWPTRPYLYVHYTANTVPTYIQVARFTLSQPGGVLTLDALSKLVLIDDMPDNASNHNGGTLRFARDKTLYISVGDDANNCQAQDRTILAGKILRIKVDDSIMPAMRSTLAPADNPFASAMNVNERLVWAYGLRNPFRFDVHPITGRVFIGDVGQNTWEEVSVANTAGLNFGWPYWEGNVRYFMGLCPVDSSLPPSTPPVYMYPNPGGASVIGAVVYRGVSFPNDRSFPSAYEDNFFFMDYYAGFLRVLREDLPSGTFALVPGRTATNWGEAYAYVADMVRGPDGAIYFVTGGGALRRIAFLPKTPGKPTNLVASLVNGRTDVQLTWTVPAPETYVDHYEVYRAPVYDPARVGYTKVSSDLALPPGSSMWTDMGAGATTGAYFYSVSAVGPTGERNATAGQVAKFTRPLGVAQVLLSVPLVTSSTLVSDQFAGFPWALARTFEASDAADPWKRYDPTKGGNDFLAVDLRAGAWLNVTAASEYRVAGAVPCARTIDLLAGWNLVGFPSMTTLSVASASAGLVGPILVEGYDSAATPYYLRRLTAPSAMNPTQAYWIYSLTDQPWTLVNDPSPSCV